MAFNLKDEEEGQPKEIDRPQPILHTPKSGGGMRVRLLVGVFVLVVVVAAGFLTYNSFFKGKAPATPKVVQELPAAKAPGDTLQPAGPAQTQPQPPGKSQTQQPAKAQAKPQPAKSQVQQQVKPSAPQQAKSALPKPIASVKKEIPPPAKKKATPPVKETPPKKETAPTKPAPEISTTGEFTIYIGSYRTKATAQDEVNRWNEAGYQAFLSEQSGWYRVALGKFPTKGKAREQAEKLKEAFEAGYWVDKFK
jgi:cell division septation protein DedD